MKKFVFLFVLSLSLLISGCSTLSGLKEPKVEFKDVYIRDASLVGTTLVFVLNVENVNEKEIKVDEVNYKVLLDGQAFAASKTEKEVRIPAKSKADVEIPLPVRYVDLFSNLSKALSSSQIEYLLEGDAKVSFFRIPFSKKGHFKLNIP